MPPSTTNSPRATEPSSPPARDPLASLRIERPEPSAGRGRKRKLWWLLALVVLSVGGFFGYTYSVQKGLVSSDLLGPRSTWMPEIMQNRIDVRLASVTIQSGRSADAVVVATGYLESRRQAKIGARAAGRIDVIFFEEGNRVTKGEILAELEHRDLDASLAAAVASVARAKASHAEQLIMIEQALADKRRADRLWKARSIAESEYDQARFAYKTAVARKFSLESEIQLAEAQQSQAEQLKENMFIRAPFDGTVISKDAEVGESILPGGMGQGSGRGSVATIADLDHLEIECDVQEDYISRISENQEAEIAVDAVQDKKYHGTVRKIIPMGDRARATIKVQVQIDDADELLFPEMSGTVYFLPGAQDIAIADKQRMFCPSSAVDNDESGNTFVWVVDPERRAQKLDVTAGIEKDGRTEILEGLAGDEKVIANPSELSEGIPVWITE